MSDHSPRVALPAQIMCEVTRGDIQEHVRLRLEAEREDKERRRKEKAEAHLFSHIRVVTDADLAAQIGSTLWFDLVDHDKVPTLALRAAWTPKPWLAHLLQVPMFERATAASACQVDDGRAGDYLRMPWLHSLWLTQATPRQLYVRCAKSVPPALALGVPGSAPRAPAPAGEAVPGATADAAARLPGAAGGRDGRPAGASAPVDLRQAPEQHAQARAPYLRHA